ncbi:MAG: DNA repair protein RadC [Pseudomonadales bacterium]|nr:DNA repair protein RadC [Pseudomonadales bacterium]
MTIKDWPQQLRPREKLLKKGAPSLSDAELLAIFLRTGVAGKSAVELATDLLQQFGGLRPILAASQSQFCQGKGLGEAKYTQLQAVLEMANRHLSETLERSNPLESPETTKRFLQSKMRHYQNEVFACLFLDSQHRVIVFEELFFGSIASANVHPREVVKRALHHNAAALIFCHNHPSGIAEPSASDQAITTTLVSALALVDVRVLDHMIVGDADITSMAERGLM